MSTLNVVKVSAGTETDGFDISYRVVVEGGEHDGTEIYTSRFPDKAYVKAGVKTAEDPFLGFTVKIEPEVAVAMGVRNLEQRVKADIVDAAGAALANFDASKVAEAIKATQG